MITPFIFTVVFYLVLLGLAFKNRANVRLEGFEIEEGDFIGKRKSQWVGKKIPFLFMFPSKKMYGIITGFSKKFTKLGRLVGAVGVFVMILFAIWGSYLLISLAINSLSAPKEFVANPDNRVVVFLPGFGLPLISGSIALISALFVHEMFHAWVGISYGYKVKQTGVGILLIFPLAYVEFDQEKEMFKSPPPHYIKFILAGVFGNVLLAAVLLLVGMFLVSGELIRLGITLNLILAIINSFPIFGITDGMHAINGLISKFIPTFEKRQGLLGYVAFFGTMVFLVPIMISLLL